MNDKRDPAVHDTANPRAVWERDIADALALRLDLPMASVYSLMAEHAPLLALRWTSGTMPQQVASEIRETPAQIRLQRFGAIEPAVLDPAQALAVMQLRPTPAPLAARMVATADVRPEDRVLEPEVGTGALVAELRRNNTMCELVAIEMESHLAQAFGQRHPGEALLRANFLDCTPDQLGSFSRILMHPPCGDGQDQRHILHALRFLTQQGRLVAICEDGERQRDVLRSIALGSGGSWEPLAPNEFPMLGMGSQMRFALVVLEG